MALALLLLNHFFPLPSGRGLLRESLSPSHPLFCQHRFLAVAFLSPFFEERGLYLLKPPVSPVLRYRLSYHLFPRAQNIISSPVENLFQSVTPLTVLFSRHTDGLLNLSPFPFHRGRVFFFFGWLGVFLGGGLLGGVSPFSVLKFPPPRHQSSLKPVPPYFTRPILPSGPPYFHVHT